MRLIINPLYCLVALLISYTALPQSITNETSQVLYIDSTIIVNSREIKKLYFGPTYYNDTNRILFTTNGAYILENVTVGDFKAYHTHFEKLSVHNSVFHKKLIFDSSLVYRLNLTGNNFKNGISLIPGVGHNLRMTDAKIIQNDFGNPSQRRDTLLYNRIDFYNTSVFSNNNIYQVLVFNECNNTNQSFIQNNLQVLIFNKTKIQNLNFRSNILSNLLFKNVNLIGVITFDSSKIRNSLSLANNDFGDIEKISFNNCILPDTIDFYNTPNVLFEVDLIVANFLDTVRWEWNYSRTRPSPKRDGSQFNPPKIEYNVYKRSYINLYKTDISKFHLDYLHFKLLLINPETNEELPFDEGRSVYEGLLKNFKDRGQMLSYELCDIEYQDYIWENKGWLVRWVRIFPKYWNNYGYDKGRVFLWVLVLLLFFTLITYRYIDFWTEHVYPITNIPKQVPWNYAKDWDIFEKATLSRLWYSFVYSSTIFFLLTLKINNINFKHRKHVVCIITIYVTGIICLAYVGNYIITR